MKNLRVITLKQIAAQAGCCHTTVSRALKNSPLLPLSTRRRIQKLAKKMGYRPIPLVSTLMVQLKKLHQVSYVSTIAWLDSGKPDEKGNVRAYSRKYLEGVKKRAEQLGYQVEVFFPQVPGTTSEGLNKILLARNIRGLILVTPFASTDMHWPIQWEHFSTVAIGKTDFKPPLHYVDADDFHNMSLCLKTLRARGYRRIGYITTPQVELVSGGICQSCFLQDHYYVPAKDRVPPLNLSVSMEPPGEYQRQVISWLKKYRPEVVICYRRRYQDYLTRLGLSIPQDIGLARIRLNPLTELPTGFWSGIHRHDERVGMAAVDLLVSMLQNNETGIPPYPKGLLIKGEWLEGKTVKKRV